MSEKWTGVKKIGDMMVCEKCGKSEVKMVSHMDFAKSYRSVYECVCGAIITMEAQRSKESMMYHGGEE